MVEAPSRPRFGVLPLRHDLPAVEDAAIMFGLGLFPAGRRLAAADAWRWTGSASA